MAKSWIGETLGGRYEIDSLLGQGGMSAVYRATDPNLRRMVAIKLIHPHLSGNPNFVNRFKEEAAAVARLRHPNIVQVHDFNVDGDTYYMVMEYLTGETLQAHIKRLNKANRFIPYQQVIEIGLQMCAALGYAHRHELIHRDIKPANIMLDIHGQAILMDFGIVKIIGGEYHTATGATLGTVKYMSPEQMRSEKVDEQSDIYSLGVTLYEMISGRVPFTADSVPTLMMMVLNDPLPDLRQTRKGIPEALLAVVEKALSKEKANRYKTMEQMAAALENAMAAIAANEPEATVIDEDLPGWGSKRVGADQADFQEPALDVRPSPAAAPQAVEQGIRPSDMPTLVDAIDEAGEKPGSVTVFEKLRQVPRWVGIAVVVVALAAIGLSLFLQPSQRTPSVDISPVNQPDELIDAATAQNIVRRGEWQTDSTITDLAFSPDGSRLGTANNREATRSSPYRYYGVIWDIEEGRQEHDLLGHEDWMSSIAFSPDGPRAATASDDDLIIIWDVSDGSVVSEINTSLGGLTAIDIAPNSRFIAGGSWDGIIGLWELDGQFLRTLDGHTSSVRDVTFSPDGATLASASDDQTIRLWSVSDGQLIYELQGHTASVRDLAFSPGGQWLVSASEDRTIALWSLSDGSQMASLEGNTEAVLRVAISSDGTLLASGADDGKVMLWTLPEGELIRVLEQLSDSITGLAFSPQGNFLVAAAWDGSIFFWGISE